MPWPLHRPDARRRSGRTPGPAGRTRSPRTGPPRSAGAGPRRARPRRCPHLRVALGDLLTVAVCKENRESRTRSRNFAVPGMPPIHSVPSKNRGSIGLIRGNPSGRSVASMTKRLPAAACRRRSRRPRRLRRELLPARHDPPSAPSAVHRSRCTSVGTCCSPPRRRAAARRLPAAARARDPDSEHRRRAGRPARRGRTTARRARLRDRAVPHRPGPDRGGAGRLPAERRREDVLLGGGGLRRCCRPRHGRSSSAGVEAHVCVLQTVLDLLAASTASWWSRTPSARATPRIATRRCCRMQAHGAEIVTSEMVLFEWLRDRGTPGSARCRSSCGDGHPSDGGPAPNPRHAGRARLPRAGPHAVTRGRQCREPASGAQGTAPTSPSSAAPPPGCATIPAGRAVPGWRATRTSWPWRFSSTCSRPRSRTSTPRYVADVVEACRQALG